MKYIFLVGDGMSDEPIEGLGGKTPLEVARIDNMNYLAKRGIVGMCRTIPEGLPPGSDVANLSLLGFDPRQYYTGRGPLEAASIGIELHDHDCAFRCNLVNVSEGLMKDFSSGHISTEEAKDIIQDLNSDLSSDTVHFYTGVSYRHICVIKGVFDSLDCTPPHDITGMEIEGYMPRGEGADAVKELMSRSIKVLAEHRINKMRRENGQTQATQIWLWGQGYKPDLPRFREKFSIDGSVITAVDLIRGIGRLAGLDIIHVEGATGFIDTNYEGKADAALGCLREKDFVFIHVEAPDEAGHLGDVNLKIRAIQDLDQRLLGRLLSRLTDDFRILVMPDHPTPISIKTHSSAPVPFILYGSGITPDGVDTYSELTAEASDTSIDEGHTLIDLLFNEGSSVK
jgi:2,3-bisphosphoglycerate-independent phosphoglycerate mutase